MNKFIEKNRRLLKFYCVIARTIGWLLVLGGFVWIVSFLSGETVRAERAETITYAMSSLLYDFVLLGLVVLGITQLIRYMFESESKPGFILRNGSQIFYIYAVFLVISTCYKYAWYRYVWFADIAAESDFSRLLLMQPFILPPIAKVLILVGLGQILKRIIPVIEESRTLV